MFLCRLRQISLQKLNLDLFDDTLIPTHNCTFCFSSCIFCSGIRSLFHSCIIVYTHTFLEEINSSLQSTFLAFSLDMIIMLYNKIVALRTRLKYSVFIMTIVPLYPPFGTYVELGLRSIEQLWHPNCAAREAVMTV